MSKEILDLLRGDDEGRALLEHPFFSSMDGSREPDREEVVLFLSQWWYPLNNFPNFLSSLIANVRSLERKTAISKILFQELGEGDVSRAHERVYVRTMEGAGFAADEVADAGALESTRRLLSVYHRGAREELFGLGCLYGTEVADLAMVTAIASSVRALTGRQELEWVDIHVHQEPDHVDMVNLTLDRKPDQALLAHEREHIVEGARAMWRAWIEFFDALNDAGAQLSRAS